MILRHVLLTILLIGSYSAFSQGKSISLAKKSVDTYITSTSDTINVNDEIALQLGSNQDGSFKYVQMLNGFNEPIKPADSRSAGKKQKIVFFKEQDGVRYLFTKFFVINIEAALMSKEIRLK